MAENDHASIRAVLSGDKEAYRTLVVRHGSTLFRLAYRITGNEADAEDVVQEAFLRGYRNLESFQARSNFGTWIYRIAVRCALDRINTRSGKEAGQVAQERIGQEMDCQRGPMETADQRAGPERLLLSREIGTLQKTAMSSLTIIERTAFVLRHIENLTTGEIASALGIAPNAAKQAVFRAVQKLRCRLAGLREKP